MIDPRALARELNGHHPAQGRVVVASGVTCQCGYWNGIDKPAINREPLAGRDGLDYHRAQVILDLLGGASPR